MRICNLMQSIALYSTLFTAYLGVVALEPRATQAATCAGLSVKSNDGDRKVAIVIDSSGSMLSTDPYNLRRAAGRVLNAWLITNAQATSSRKADLVTVIDFDSSATVLYPLGDPAGANSSFDSIDSSGGTYIAGGVLAAISQLTQPGSGDTKDRSSIVVFTDGEDSSTKTLVDQIKAAANQGIRVSFGFLDSTSSIQDKTVLEAIRDSGGVYATITAEDASINFINFAILNGLTLNDNPSGNSFNVLAGLSVPYRASTESVFYNSQSGEQIRFTIRSYDAGPLTVEAFIAGRSVNSTITPAAGAKDLYVSTPIATQIQIKVKANSNITIGALYVIGATSNMTIPNCTVAVLASPSAATTSAAIPSGTGTNQSEGTQLTATHGGVSKGVIVAISVSVPLVIGLLGLGLFFLRKRLFGKVGAVGKGDDKGEHEKAQLHGDSFPGYELDAERRADKRPPVELPAVEMVETELETNGLPRLQAPISETPQRPD